MPVTTDTLHHMPRLNRWFAASSILAVVASGWMLWHDFNRPWRHIQGEYFNLRSAMAHLDYLSYESPAEKERHAKLLAAVEDARRELSAPEKKKEEKDLLVRQKDVSGQAQATALDFGNRNAELQVKLFNFEEAKTLRGPKDSETIKLKKDYEESEKQLAVLKQKQDALEDATKDIKAKMKVFYHKKTDAEKALASYDKGRNDAQKADEMYGPGIMREALNMPGLDYLAPKGVPGREEVKQVFMKPIRFNYNFLDSYVTDRCITCHVGIDSPAYTIEAFAKKTQTGLTADEVKRVLDEENQKLMKGFTRSLAEANISDITQPATDAAMREKFVRRLVGSANVYLDQIRRPEISADEMVRFFLKQGDKPLTRGAIEDELSKSAMRIFRAEPPLAEDGKTPLAFDQMSEQQKMAYVANLTGAMNLYLKREGRPEIDFKKELRAHPHLDLYLSPNSAHPLKNMGCSVCHEGSGQETDFVLAAHTPKDKDEEKLWARKYYVRELGIPLQTFQLVEDFWERPMLLPGYTSASCRKCHQQTFDLERYRTEALPSAKRVVDGRELFTTVGCINCHAVEGLTDSRKVGPDLAHVSEKLSRGFMERWIDYPKNFRPSTWMPHFFHQENNLPSSHNEFDPDPVLRTETEIGAIVDFLQTFSKPYEPRPLPQGVSGDAQRGQDLFTSIGCLACHANLDAKDPMDDAGRSFGEHWIVTDLMQTKGVPVDEAKKQFDGMSKNDRTRYAMRHFTQDRRAEATASARKEELAADREGRDPDPKKLYVPPVFTRVAPDLSGMGTKLVPDANDAQQISKATDWLYNWLREPRHYSSYTRMPRLFRENYYQYDGPEEQRKKNDQDMLDVAAFLLTLRNDEFDRTPFPNDEKHQEQMRFLIMDLLGGQNTEAVSKKILADEKNSPDDPYGRLTASIVAGTYKSFGEGDEAKRKVTALIAGHARTLEERQRLYLGMKMIGHYGCYACHNIAGFEDAVRPGTELTLWAEKFMSQLDFAFYSPPFEHEIEEQPEVFDKLFIDNLEFAHLVRDAGENPKAEILHNHAAFAYHKLRNPRIWDRKKIKKPYEKLKMPNFFLNEEEARSLVSYLLSMRQANVYKEVQIAYDKTPAGKIAAGRALVRDLNCIGCHKIEGNDPVIQQYYSNDLNTPPDTDPRSVRFKPPLLWGEGAKVQYNWLFTFLNNVEMLRPWMKARMPSFALTKEQTTTLVEYFAGQAQDESHLLRKEIDPIVKLITAAHADGGTDNSWFTEDKYEDQSRFLKSWAIGKQQTGTFEWQIDPTAKDYAAKLAAPYDKTLKRAEFLSSLFNVQYPFSDPIMHLADEERFKRGEEMFYNLKCLACHVAGDPKKPGTTTDIKAPNFALTYKRLRYDWVINWLQDPQAIQPGANMPQIFQGGSAFAALPQPERDKLEAQFGKTVEEQSHLLVDFIYTLGARGYTAIQPGATEAQAKPAEPAQPAGQFDFDSPAPGEKKPEDKAPTSQPAKGEFDF